MRYLLPLIFLMAAAGFCQPRLQTFPGFTGTVVSHGPGFLRIRTSGRVTEIKVDANTRVVKGGSVAALPVGKEVRVQVRRYEESFAVASQISDTPRKVSGMARKSALRFGCDVEVVPSPGATPVPVCITAETSFGASRYLGERVEVTGWDFGSGGVEATAVVVYDTDVPASRTR